MTARKDGHPLCNVDNGQARGTSWRFSSHVRSRFDSGAGHEQRGRGVPKRSGKPFGGPAAYYRAQGGKAGSEASAPSNRQRRPTTELPSSRGRSPGLCSATIRCPSTGRGAASSCSADSPTAPEPTEVWLRGPRSGHLFAQVAHPHGRAGAQGKRGFESRRESLAARRGQPRNDRRDQDGLTGPGCS